MGALTYAEIKAIASGNPLVLEKATIDAEVAKLSSLAASFDQERWRLKMRRASIKEALAGIAAHAHGYALDALTLQEQSRNGWDFTPHYRTDGDKALNAQIGTQVKTCSALADKAKGAAAACTIAGWTLVVEKRYFGTELSLRSLRTGYIHAIDRKGVELRDTAGVIGHLVLSALDELKRLPDMMAQRQVMLEGQLADADVALSTEFEHGERLSQLVKRQREIEAELDLDKDEAGTATAAEAGGSMPTEEQAVEA